MTVYLCSSVSNKAPHTMVDASKPAYRDAAGNVRQWQRCLGCGNVASRVVTTADDAALELFEADLFGDAIALAYQAGKASEGFIMGTVSYEDNYRAKQAAQESRLAALQYFLSR